MQKTAVLVFAAVIAASGLLPGARGEELVRDSFGGIIRGDVSAKKLSLVFTGDEFGESLASILKVLDERKIRGSFFVTGNFVAQAELAELLQQAIREGHYIGPHSNKHPLYASWDERAKSLVTRDEFTADLRQNIAGLRALGALGEKGAMYFIPPYEQFNRDQVEWCKPLDVRLFNFTPGSGSNRDYMREDDPHFQSSQKIYDDILAYEKKDPHGLNGFILLLHLGSGRKDPFHIRLGALCDELQKRGYEFARVDRLLAAP
ncbi:MAG TPA: polysaccharide deacetylase family protein [Lacipirellulaceae bacterium]|jgi:peptidoglycan/xylan/chitin deacetylase (PgdA/CDA1 family)|nr:polysaccharide deacetylase family protein [Lacipirellulaceae bacterium]